MDRHIVLNAEKICKSFSQGGDTLSILHQVNLSIAAGEIVALVGPSGAGKSTLLQILGLLDTPDRGEITIKGEMIAGTRDSRRSVLRREHIGFVYQAHHLLPEFSALENVMMPQMIAGVSRERAKNRAAELLDLLKLSHRFDHRPDCLSGGECQRVAIARALANKPDLIMADEPTGNLDPETAAGVFDLLMDIVRESGTGALIATHNMDLADQMDRILELKNGHVLGY